MSSNTDILSRPEASGNGHKRRRLNDGYCYAADAVFDVNTDTSEKLEYGRLSGDGAERTDYLSSKDRSPAVHISIGDDEWCLVPEELLDQELNSQLQERFQGADSPVHFTVRNLLDWPDEPVNVRWDLFRLIGSHTVSCVVDFHGCDKTPDNLFDAVLGVLEGDENIERCERGKRAAIEAAVFVHPNALEVACGRLAKRLKEL
ncbi:MAG: hypothetical protein IH991_14680, partial [Planctomycetes bacterium]|nr:hypothetical protein [Planctomycetota bacterium]